MILSWRTSFEPSFKLASATHQNHSSSLTRNPSHCKYTIYSSLLSLLTYTSHILHSTHTLMRKQNSVPLLPLLLLYLLALFYLGPPHPFAAAHPFFPFSRSRHSSNEPQEPPSQPNDNTIALEQPSHSSQTKLDSSLLVEHNAQQRFRNHGNHHGHHQDQDQEQEVLTLRHILHHGGVRYPSLFRQKDLRPADVLLSEMLTGQALTHRIKTAQTTTLKPREDQQIAQQGQGQTSKKVRSQGFRSLDETSLGPESWTRESVMAPDVTDRETILQLAKMNYNSYTEVATPGWYDLEGNWSVVSSFWHNHYSCESLVGVSFGLITKTKWQRTSGYEEKKKYLLLFSFLLSLACAFVLCPLLCACEY